jgi:hypothetical protein
MTGGTSRSQLAGMRFRDRAVPDAAIGSDMSPRALVRDRRQRRGTPAAPVITPRIALGVRLWEHVRAKVVRHRVSLAWLIPVLLVAGVVHAWGMSTYPNWIDDSGTYLAQAWAVQYRHSLAHYTYWYDHVPGGWIQMALWSTLTNGFNRYRSAMAFGHECMLIAKVVACGVMFALGRRLGYSRPAASAAVLLYALCPLVLIYSRWIYLDNIVIPWILLAFYLAYSPRRSLWAGVGAGVAFAMAALSKETALVWAPAVAWAMIQNGDRRNRHVVWTVSATVSVALMALYPLYAVFKNELLEGPGHVSLEWTVKWQLLDRGSSGSVLQPGGGRDLFMGWLGYDKWLLLAGLAMLPLGFCYSRLRPVTLALLIQALMLCRNGYLPVMHVINLMPFAALLIPGVLDAIRGSSVALRRRRRPRGGRRARHPHPMAVAIRATPAVAVVSAFAVFVMPTWAVSLHGMTTVKEKPAFHQAVLWLADNVERDKVIVVDDSEWVDLVHNHKFRSPIWAYKVDLDPAVRRPLRRIDYIAVDDVLWKLGEAREKFPSLFLARKHAKAVASFGKGDDRVTIWRVAPHWRLPPPS